MGALRDEDFGASLVFVGIVAIGSHLHSPVGIVLDDFHQRSVQAGDDAKSTVENRSETLNIPNRGFDDVHRVRLVYALNLSEHSRRMTPEVWRDVDVGRRRRFLAVLDQAMNPDTIFEVDGVCAGGTAGQQVNVVAARG